MMVVVAVARLGINVGGKQHAVVVVEAKCFDREPGDFRELTDAVHDVPGLRAMARLQRARLYRRPVYALQQGESQSKTGTMRDFLCESSNLLNCRFSVLTLLLLEAGYSRREGESRSPHTLFSKEQRNETTRH